MRLGVESICFKGFCHRSNRLVSTVYSVIVDEFEEGLSSLRQLVQFGQMKNVVPKTRVASVRASTLLLASTFEEFIREMAREFAIQVVAKATSVNDLPDDLLETAWRRTLDELARNKGTARSKKESLEIVAKAARPKFDAVCSFMEGDIEQNIFDDLIHNENNMRPNEINKLFKISGLRNICLEICKNGSLQDCFDEVEQGKTHGVLIDKLEKFFQRRNEIAHSLNSASSNAPDEVFRDIDFFSAFSKDLCLTLESQ